MNNKDKIIDISKRLGLSHIGSCLSVLPILEKIYSIKTPGDIVGLSGAHSHLAHLVVRAFEQEKIGENAKSTTYFPTQALIEKYGIHCDRDAGCDITGGSLAHSGIALGMAIANPDIAVHWIETDGSLAEGSSWETLRLKTLLNVSNLKVYVNMNGYSALEVVDKEYLKNRLIAFCSDVEIWETDNTEEFTGVGGHYKVL